MNADLLVVRFSNCICLFVSIFEWILDDLLLYALCMVGSNCSHDLHPRCYDEEPFSRTRL